MDGEFRIFVWSQYRTDYSDGLAVAVAKSLEDAIKQVERVSGMALDIQAWGPLEVYPIREAMAFARSGGM